MGCRRRTRCRKTKLCGLLRSYGGGGKPCRRCVIGISRRAKASCGARLIARRRCSRRRPCYLDYVIQLRFGGAPPIAIASFACCWRGTLTLRNGSSDGFSGDLGAPDAEVRCPNAQSVSPDGPDPRGQWSAVGFSVGQGRAKGCGVLTPQQPCLSLRLHASCTRRRRRWAYWTCTSAPPWRTHTPRYRAM